MGVAGDEAGAVDFKIENDADSPADPPFFALEVVLASRQANYLGIRERVPGKNRVSMKRRCVLAFQRKLIAHSFCQLEVFDAEDGVSRQSLAQLEGDVQVARTDHSI